MSETKAIRSSAVRAQDLTTRERVNFVVDSRIINMLREQSRKQKQPMSRIIDAALSVYLKHSAASNDFQDNIVLYHDFSIIIHSKPGTPEVMNVIEIVCKYFEHYIISSCLVNRPGHSPNVGTIIRLYIADNQSDKFTELCDNLSNYEDEVMIDVFLDNKAAMHL